MFVAKDKSGVYISIENALPDVEYYCPYCNEPLMQRRGDINAHHFAHKFDSNCGFSYGMTDWHFEWQQAFPAYCREVLFRNDNGDVRIADIATHDLVVEFQHSGITTSEIASRTAFHRSAGRDVWWVFDRRGRSLNELIPHNRWFAHDGCSVGSDSIARTIISGINSPDPSMHFRNSSCDIFGHTLILDYGYCCVLLGGFDGVGADAQYASCCYILNRKLVLELIQNVDKLHAKYGVCWMYDFMEDNAVYYARQIQQICNHIWSLQVCHPENLKKDYIWTLFVRLNKYVLVDNFSEQYTSYRYPEYSKLFYVPRKWQGSGGMFQPWLSKADACDDDHAFDKLMNVLEGDFEVEQISLSRICYELIMCGYLP